MESSKKTPDPEIEKKTETPKKDAEWGSWERPLDIDAESYDPLTIARMTDHNVRGVGKAEKKAEKKNEAA